MILGRLFARNKISLTKLALSVFDFHIVAGVQRLKAEMLKGTEAEKKFKLKFRFPIPFKMDFISAVNSKNLLTELLI